MSDSALSGPAARLPLPKLYQRLDSLDLLRGIAILGIFLMNTWTMSMPQDAYTNPASYTPRYVPFQGFPVNGAAGGSTDEGAAHVPTQPLTGGEYWTYLIIHEFADMKFITMFSMMFGAGIILQGQRAAARGLAPWRIHYGRMAVLLLIGLAHAYGLWYGDILTTYAVCGMLLFPLRRMPPAALAGAGIVLIAGATFINLNSMLGWHIPPFERLDALNHELWMRAHVDPTADMPQEITADTPWAANESELTAYRGGWWMQMRHRAWESLRAQTVGFLTWDFLRCGGSILVGMALLRLRFFHGEWSRGAYAALAVLLVPIGWIITYLGVVFMNRIGWREYGIDSNDPVFSVWGLGVEFNYWGSLLTELGYLACGVLLALWAANPARRLLRRCLVPIRAIGRMALTCYILETLIGTTIFYGHGFGLFGRLWRSQQLIVVAGTWAVLLIIAPLWLRYFRQGPLEWLWHRIVYWRGEPPPLKDPTEGVAAAST